MSKCIMGSKMINATEVNEENALFHSLRVNGGQAITHGKDLSSCTKAGSAASQALSQNRRQRRRSDRENCHYRARRERPPCEGKNKIAEQGWKERSAIGKTTLSPPTSTRSPRS